MKDVVQSVESCRKKLSEELSQAEANAERANQDAQKKVVEVKQKIANFEASICGKNVNIITSPANSSFNLPLWREQVERNRQQYQDRFGINHDDFMSAVEKIQLPEISPVEKPWLQFMPNLPGTEIDRVWEAIDCAKWCENGDIPFSEILLMSDERSPQVNNGSYAIILDASQEPPPHFDGQAHDARFYRKMQGHIYQNLTEGMIFDTQWFDKHKEHTAVKGITYLVDSMTSGEKCFPAGRVPRLRWYDAKLRVFFDSSGHPYDYLRPRRQFLYY